MTMDLTLISVVAAVALSFLNIHLVSAQDYINLANSSQPEVNKNQRNSEKILSRKRRYLIFPEGSSLQLVFDEIIPIVDYNNWLILGVTVALAWELPSKPPSEQLEEIRDKLNDGTLFLRKDENVNDLQYVDKPKEPQNLLRPSSYTPSQNYFYSEGRRWDSGFQSKNSFPSTSYYPKSSGRYPTSFSQDYRGYVFKTNPNNYAGSYKRVQWPQSQKIPFWEDLGRRKSPSPPLTYPQKTYPQQTYPQRTYPQRTYPQKTYPQKTYPQNTYPQKTYPNIVYPSNSNRRHHIYPVFGKRSIRSASLTKDEILHLEYHRKSRHQLYSKIEKYFISQGKHGQQCVLKLLCETGQKRNETEPGSFLGEIMRAIFTFPEGHADLRNSKYEKYEQAHGHEGNCTDQYPNCPHTFWFNNM